MSTTPAFVGVDTLIASLWRVASARGLTAEVEVCPAVSPGRHRDRGSLARAAEEAVHGHQEKALSKSVCAL
ncbi:hypothetical protein HFP71_03520 [Streptomyces sp. ARC32]